jgi:hypothetical protein
MADGYNWCLTADAQRLKTFLFAPITADEFDLVASPMRTAFVNTPFNIAPYTAVAPTIPLNTFPARA